MDWLLLNLPDFEKVFREKGGDENMLYEGKRGKVEMRTGVKKISYKRVLLNDFRHQRDIR